MGSPNKFSPQNHLFFGQFSLSIDIYIQTYFNIYLVLVLASFADTPCYPLNLFQGLFGFFADIPFYPPIYFNACPISLLAALRNRTQKIKTYISEKQNYNSSAAQRVYYIHISQPTIRNRHAEQTCNFFRGNICLYFLLCNTKMGSPL